MVFVGTMGAYEPIYCQCQIQMNKKEIEIIYRHEMHLKKFFVCALIQAMMT